MKFWRVVLPVVVIATAVALQYFAPHWAVHRLATAIQERDSNALSSHIDFPALQENVKAQVIAKMPKLSPGAVDQMAQRLVSLERLSVLLGGTRSNDRAGDMANGARSIALAVGLARMFTVSYVDWSSVQVESRHGKHRKFFLRRYGLMKWNVTGADIPWLTAASSNRAGGH